MARKEIITFIDDLDGSEASGTVTFSLDGVGYEIDLSEANQDALREVLSPYVAGARKVVGDRRKRRSR